MGSHFPSNPSETRESTALPLGFPEQLDVLGKHRRLMEVYWVYWVCGTQKAWNYQMDRISKLWGNSSYLSCYHFYESTYSNWVGLLIWGLVATGTVVLLLIMYQTSWFASQKNVEHGFWGVPTSSMYIVYQIDWFVSKIVVKLQRCWEVWRSTVLYFLILEFVIKSVLSTRVWEAECGWKSVEEMVKRKQSGVANGFSTQRLRNSGGS